MERLVGADASWVGSVLLRPAASTSSTVVPVRRAERGRVVGFAGGHRGSRWRGGWRRGGVGATAVAVCRGGVVGGAGCSCRAGSSAGCEDPTFVVLGGVTCRGWGGRCPPCEAAGGGHRRHCRAGDGGSDRCCGSAAGGRFGWTWFGVSVFRVGSGRSGRTPAAVVGHSGWAADAVKGPHWEVVVPASQ